jgi:hypothetical protein
MTTPPQVPMQGPDQQLLDDLGMSTTAVHIHSDGVPVWTTQGGGLACSSGDDFVWHEVPQEFAGSFHVGDPIPEEWGIHPANQAAMDIMSAEEYDNLDELWP